MYCRSKTYIMRKITLLLILCTTLAFAQKKSHKEPLSGIKKVSFKSNVQITIVAGTTNELVIEEIARKKNNDHWDEIGEREEKWEDKDNKKKVDRKKGLRAIYPGGEDNTNGFGFSISRENGVLMVIDLKSHFQRKPIKITLPKTMNLSVDAGNLGGVSIDGFSSEVEVDTSVGKIDLKNVTGPITAHTSVGLITVDFSTVNQSSPISISSSVGEIDVTLPSNTKANLNLRTNGTIYTNFDIKAQPKKGLKNVSGLRKVNKNINGGGVTIKLKSSMGNIYLRKK